MRIGKVFVAWVEKRAYIRKCRTLFTARSPFFRAKSVTGYFRPKAQKKICGVNRTNDG
jgi:hypothetical protein